MTIYDCVRIRFLVLESAMKLRLGKQAISDKRLKNIMHGHYKILL